MLLRAHIARRPVPRDRGSRYAPACFSREAKDRQGGQAGQAAILLGIAAASWYKRWEKIPWMQQQRVSHLQSVCAMASAGTGLRGVALQGYAGSKTSALITATHHIMRLCVPANTEGSSCCLWESLSQGLCCAANQAMLGVSMSCSTSSSGHALPRPTASATTMATLVVVTLIAFV